MIFKEPESAYPPRLKVMAHADAYETPKVFLHADFEGPPEEQEVSSTTLIREVEGTPVPLWMEIGLALLASLVTGALLVLAILFVSRWF